MTVSEFPTPALVLDLDVLEANVAALAAHAEARGYAVRPVAKIHKSSQIAKLQSAAGAVGTCVATLGEAEVMADAGIEGVLLFTSVVTAAKLERLAALNLRATDLIVAVDDARNIAQLEAAVRPTGKPLQVIVDAEVGGGRTGVATPAEAVALAQAIEASPSLVYAGIQGYNGIHQADDDYAARRAIEVGVLDHLATFVDALKAAGLPPRIITGGGTGSHDIDHEHPVLTECQAGTYVFMDAYYGDAVLRKDGSAPFAPSLFVRTTVISNAQPGFVITDAGGKEVDGIFAPLQPVVLRGAPAGSTYSIVGDDMGRIDLPEGAEQLPVGAIVDIQPPHCYATAIMYSHYTCVRGDEIVDRWPVDAFSNA